MKKIEKFKNYNNEDHGYLIFEKNQLNLNFEIINKIFEKDFNNNKYSKNHYENVSIIPREEVLTIDPYNEILKKLYFKLDVNFKKKISFENLWLQKSSNSNYKKDDLPFIPHIDKARKFKVMVYLNDVDLENGPIFFLNMPGKNFEEKRKRLSDDHKKNKENVIYDFKISEYSPAIGKFGTSIFFDTNCPHFAGEQKINKVRKVLRFNFKLY